MSFTPTRVSISAITKANPAVVTTSTAHGLTTGQVVRVNVPQNYGMVELNKLAAIITVLSSTTFSLQYSQSPAILNVDSRTYTTFVIPSKPSLTAEILPIGAGATPVTTPAPLVLDKVCQTLVDDAWVNIATVNQPF